MYLSGVTEYINIGFGSSGVFLCPDVFFASLGIFRSVWMCLGIGLYIGCILIYLDMFGYMYILEYLLDIYIYIGYN